MAKRTVFENDFRCINIEVFGGMVEITVEDKVMENSNSIVLNELEMEDVINAYREEKGN